VTHATNAGLAQYNRLVKVVVENRVANILRREVVLGVVRTCQAEEHINAIVLLALKIQETKGRKAEDDRQVQRDNTVQGDTACQVDGWDIRNVQDRKHTRIDQ
jgi:hypothetical protein